LAFVGLLSAPESHLGLQDDSFAVLESNKAGREKREGTSTSGEAGRGSGEEDGEEGQFKLVHFHRVHRRLNDFLPVFNKRKDKSKERERWVKDAHAFL
jgi:hypothetical protein